MFPAEISDSIIKSFDLDQKLAYGINIEEKIQPSEIVNDFYRKLGYVPGYRDYNLDVYSNDHIIINERMSEQNKGGKLIVTYYQKEYIKMIFREVPSDTPYPTDIPFTEKEIRDLASGIKGDNEITSIVDPTWSTVKEYMGSYNYIYTLHESYNHGPLYRIEFGEPVYIGSYNYGYKDGKWKTYEGSTIYKKGSILEETISGIKYIIDPEYRNLAYRLENSKELSHKVGKPSPKVIGNYIVKRKIEHEYIQV